jgi:hypothetical protein
VPDPQVGQRLVTDGLPHLDCTCARRPGPPFDR